MQIKFLGTGGAFDVDYGNSAAVVNFNGHNYLIDCGFMTYPALRKYNQIEQIDFILLTHLHNDHSGSLANLLLHYKIFGLEKKPVLLYPFGEYKIQVEEFLRIQVVEPDKYVKFKPLEEHDGVTYLDTMGCHAEGMQTFSYIFEDEQERLVYSGDLAKFEVLFDHLKELDEKKTTIFHDISFNEKNNGHAFYKKLLPYQEQYKIYGYHCDPTQNPSDNTIPLVAQQKELLF